MRRPNRSEIFSKIKEIGMPVGSVIDIGVFSETADLIENFADVKHLLVEPVAEWSERIEKRYTRANIDFELLNVAASDSNGKMNLEIYSVDDKPITHSNLTSDAVSENVREIDVRTVDSLMAERDFPEPFLFKLDVDGVEMKILQGATDTLRKCSVVAIEAGNANFMERAGFLVDHGFELFDIVDICYYDGRLRQFDMVFLNSALVRKFNVRRFNQEKFDKKKWEKFAA